MNQHRGDLHFASWSSHPRPRRSLGDYVLLLAIALPLVSALSWAAWILLQRGGQ
jgi:hypothetical protein